MKHQYQYEDKIMTALLREELEKMKWTLKVKNMLLNFLSEKNTVKYCSVQWTWLASSLKHECIRMEMVH